MCRWPQAAKVEQTHPACCSPHAHWGPLGGRSCSSSPKLSLGLSKMVPDQLPSLAWPRGQLTGYSNPLLLAVSALLCSGHWGPSSQHPSAVSSRLFHGVSPGSERKCCLPRPPPLCKFLSSAFSLGFSSHFRSFLGPGTHCLPFSLPHVAIFQCFDTLSIKVKTLQVLKSLRGSFFAAHNSAIFLEVLFVCLWESLIV